MKNKIIISLLTAFICCSVHAQPRHVSIKNIIQAIPVIPPTIEEMHSEFTGHSSFGEYFRDGELLNPPFYALKSIIAELLNDRIRERMKLVTRTDFPDSVIYEDERLKLALRPVIDLKKHPIASRLPAEVKIKMQRILAMQLLFDWQIYSDRDYKIVKLWRQQIAAKESVGNMKAMIEKIKLQKQQFSQQQELWTTYFNKFSKAANELDEELSDLSFTEVLSPADRKTVLLILADVQARSLEAIEKLVTNEMLIVTNAEVVFQDQRIAAMYSDEKLTD